MTDPITTFADLAALIAAHHATADGELIHLCRCTPEEKETLL